MNYADRSIDLKSYQHRHQKMKVFVFVLVMILPDGQTKIIRSCFAMPPKGC